MTYDERRMCVGYSNLIEIQDLVQHIYRVGAFNLLSPKSKKLIISIEDKLGKVMDEMYKYVSSHTEDDKERGNDGVYR